MAKDIRSHSVRVLNKRNGEILTVRAGFNLKELNKHVFAVIEDMTEDERKQYSGEEKK